MHNATHVAPGVGILADDRPHQFLRGSQRRANGVEQPIRIERFLNRPDGF